MNRKVSLKNVAALAGVATGTVSKYISNPNLVKPQNREKIARAIKELNYTPNVLAQALGRGRSYNILLYIISENMIFESTWLHQLPLIQVVGDYINTSKYNMHIKVGKTNETDAVLEYIKKNIDGKNIDGVALVSTWQVSKNIISMLTKKQFPFVLVDNHIPEIETNGFVIDNAQLAKDLVGYLYDKGHRKIGFISVPTEQQHIKERYQGFIEGLKERGLELNESWITYGDFSIQSGRKAAYTILKQRELPTAVIGGNDNMAVGFLNGVIEHGIKVPEEMSIVGIDNSIVAEACIPQLTTAQLPMKEIGKAAIESLINLIENDQFQITKKVFQCSLVERNSVATIKNTK
jgi:LacI family transcriptional regulator